MKRQVRRQFEALTDELERRSRIAADSKKLEINQ
jgi:hypothetical protein